MDVRNSKYNVCIQWSSVITALWMNSVCMERNEQRPTNFRQLNVASHYANAAPLSVSSIVNELSVVCALWVSESTLLHSNSVQWIGTCLMMLQTHRIQWKCSRDPEHPFAIHQSGVNSLSSRLWCSLEWVQPTAIQDWDWETYRASLEQLTADAGKKPLNSPPTHWASGNDTVWHTKSKRV